MVVTRFARARDQPRLDPPGEGAYDYSVSKERDGSRCYGFERVVDFSLIVRDFNGFITYWESVSI